MSNPRTSRHPRPRAGGDLRRLCARMPEAPAFAGRIALLRLGALLASRRAVFFSCSLGAASGSVDRAAGLLTALARARRNAGDRELHLGGEFTLAEQADAVLAAARQASGLERRVVDRRPWRRACRRRSPSGPGPGSPRHSPWRTMLLKPRFGMRMWSGIWPPSKPLIETPERALAPFWPRPAVLPLPEPIPRPTRMRLLRAPALSRSSLSFISVHSLSLWSRWMEGRPLVHARVKCNAGADRFAALYRRGGLVVESEGPNGCSPTHDRRHSRSPPGPASASATGSCASRGEQPGLSRWGASTPPPWWGWRRMLLRLFGAKEVWCAN